MRAHVLVRQLDDLKPLFVRHHPVSVLQVLQVSSTLLGKVAAQAQGGHVRQVAEPTTLAHRQDMISIPERVAMLGKSELELLRSTLSLRHTRKIPLQPQRVQTARRTNPFVPTEDLGAQILRIRSEFVLMHALRATESPLRRKHVSPAPAAQRSARDRIEPVGHIATPKSPLETHSTEPTEIGSERPNLRGR